MSLDDAQGKAANKLADEPGDQCRQYPLKYITHRTLLHCVAMVG